MKIRWTDDSLRLRITPTELAALQQGESVEACLTIAALDAPPALALSWRVLLRVDPTVADSVLTAAAPAANMAIVLLAGTDMAKLSASDCEGVYFPASAAGSRVTFLIEKDFPCLHPRGGKAHDTPTETFLAPPDFALRKS